MATQEDNGIPFTVHQQQHNFRLLELPPDLLALITSERPPSLALKSSRASATTSANAVLCTDTKTYQIRQVHSSNSVLVLQPMQIASIPSDEDLIPTSGMSAIARCTTMLELLPATVDASALLRNVLQDFSDPQSGRRTKQVGMENGRSKSEIFDDVPLSAQEFEDAWTELCAFESDSTCWVPTAACLCGIWRSIMSAVAIKGLSLQDSVYIHDLVELVIENGFEEALLHAVLGRLHLVKTIPMDGWATISADKCVPWVGSVLLASESLPPGGIAISDFLQHWQNLLPEAWRPHVALDLLREKYSQPSSNKIMPRNAITTGGRHTGKWHEKFKNPRR